MAENKRTLEEMELGLSVQLTKNWRSRFNLDKPEENPEIQQTAKKAFLVRKEDLEAIVKSTDFHGMRIYFGSNTTDHLSPMRLILVPVDENGNDIIDYKNPTHPGIYDFSMPCPDTCDRNHSALLTGSIPAEE